MVATDDEAGKGDKAKAFFFFEYGRNVLSTVRLEVFLFGVGTVLCLERDT